VLARCSPLASRGPRALPRTRPSSSSSAARVSWCNEVCAGSMRVARRRGLFNPRRHYRSAHPDAPPSPGRYRSTRPGRVILYEGELPSNFAIELDGEVIYPSIRTARYMLSFARRLTPKASPARVYDADRRARRSSALLLSYYKLPGAPRCSSCRRFEFRFPAPPRAGRQLRAHPDLQLTNDGDEPFNSCTESPTTRRSCFNRSRADARFAHV